MRAFATNPVVASAALPRGVTGLHDAALLLPAVAVWGRQDDILDDLLAAGGELLLGGRVMLAGGDAVRADVRALVDVDRVDIAPVPPQTQRSLLWYVCRVGAAPALDVIARHAREAKKPLGVTAEDLAAARERARNHPRLAEALAEHIASGAFVMSADGSDAFAATVGPNGDFTKTIRTIYRVLGLMLGLIALFLALYLPYIYATREVPAPAAAQQAA